MTAEGLAEPVSARDDGDHGLWPTSRRESRRLSCAESGRRPTRRSQPSPTCWSSSTARNSRIASPGACASMRPIFRSSIMYRPSVWAWRPWRARAMRRYIDHVMALLPFEPAAMERLGGPPCSYVGHPLSERVDRLRARGPTKPATRRSPPLIVLLMPGSRARRNRAHARPVFERAAERIARRRPARSNSCMPAVPPLAGRLSTRQVCHLARAGARGQRAAETRMRPFARRALAIVKSGTSTLELAVAGIPMVATYRVAPH